MLSNILRGLSLGRVTREKSNTGSVVSSVAHRQAVVASRCVPEGHWGVECNRPVDIVLPDRLHYECERRGLALPSRFGRLMVTFKELRQFEAKLPAGLCEKLFAGGGKRWETAFDNLVTNAGLDAYLDVHLSNGTQISTWYVILTDASPTVAAGDTASSHAGWDEFTDYDEASRQTWTDGGVSSQSVDNSGSTADFTVSADSSSIGGGGLISDNTKSGTSGTLQSVGAFSGGNKAADDGDTISVTGTFTMADS